MNKQKEKKKRFYQQKSFHITMGSIAGVILLVLLAFRVSPAPGAWIIRSVFNRNSEKVLVALEKHRPDVSVTGLVNQTYRNNDGDARLDVYYPSATPKSLRFSTPRR